MIISALSEICLHSVFAEQTRENELQMDYVSIFFNHSYSFLTDFTVHFTAEDSCKFIQDVRVTRNRYTWEHIRLLSFSQSQREFIGEQVEYLSHQFSSPSAYPLRDWW